MASRLCRHRFRCWLLALAAGLLPESGEAAPPEVRLVNPPALRPGHAAVLRLEGKELEGLRALWTSWAGVLERNDSEGWEATGTSARIPVQVPVGFPNGVEMIRVLGTNGVSNPLLVAVDGLPSVQVGEGHTSVGTALPLALPTVAMGTCDENGFRYHRVFLEAGQRLGLEVVAERLGSQADPVMRVLDATGVPLASAGDSPGLGADCALEFVAPAKGDYLVEIRDAEYLGGASHFYRLRAGEFPVGIVAGKGAVPEKWVPGRNPDDGMPWASSVSESHGAGRVLRSNPTQSPTTAARWRVPGASGGNAWTPRLARVAGAVAAEAEPNDAAEAATPWVEGSVVAGGFGSRLDTDWYGFQVKTSGWWRIEVLARSLGWASDPVLRLSQADGKVLATAATGEPDPVLFHRFEAPGLYRIAVSESAQRWGPGRGYLLRMTPDAAAFRLSTESERLHIAAGGKQTLKLKVEARGYDGSIRIEAAGLPAGVTVENPVIEARKKEWDLVLRSAPEAEAGRSGAVTLVGRVATDGAADRVVLDLAPAWRKTFPGMLVMPAGFLDAVWVAVTSPEPTETKPSAATP